MGRVQPDGTVVESNIKLVPRSEIDKASRQHKLNNYSLKSGIVIEILYPENKNNLSKKNIEYTVQVVEKMPNDSSAVSIYNNCSISNLFGTTNNKLNYTLQPSSDSMLGSSVLILCLEGRSSNGSAIIIGGLNDVNSTKYSAKDGQFYDFNFNGIQQFINNDGEYLLLFNSKTNLKNKKANANAAGTFIKIDKEGRLSLGDNKKQSFSFDRVAQASTWTNGAESISIDQKNKTLSLRSSSKLNIDTQDELKISSKGTIDSSSERDYNISSGSNLSIRSKANTTIKADSSMNLVAGAEFKARAGSVSTVEAGLLAQIKAPIVKLAGGTNPVGIAGISISLGFDSHGSPVISTLLTGSFSTFAGT